MTFLDKKNNAISVIRPVVRARQGSMLDIRQSLDGPEFDKLGDAEFCCMYAIIDHYGRRLGMSMHA